MGDTLQQTVDGRPILTWHLPVVRLWELEASEVLQQGTLGLVVLSPLMHGASAPLVEQAVDRVLRRAPQPQPRMRWCCASRTSRHSGAEHPPTH